MRGAAEGLQLVRGLAAPHEEVGDALERLDGRHDLDRTLFAVGFYSEQVVPRIIDVMLGNKAFGQVRAEACDGPARRRASRSASGRA